MKPARWLTCLVVVAVLAAAACTAQEPTVMSIDPDTAWQDLPDEGPVELTPEQWEERLGAERYRVLRQHGTERAFTGAYDGHKAEGVYRCAGCGNALFASDTKYDSGSGWPSFYAPVAADAVGTTRDAGLGMVRTEVHCARCGGHQGHVFTDGPQPTGLRYCINSASLVFDPASE